MAERVDLRAVPSRTVPARRDDWPAQTTETFVRLVDSVADKTHKVTTVARAVVYGLMAGIVGLTAFVLLCIGIFRFLDVYLPDAVFGEDHMWAVYLIVGVVFTGVGLFLLRAAGRPSPEPAR
jgi:hypothetical protein